MPTNPIDLTTLAAVKSWVSANGTAPINTSDDANVQACITAFSAIFLWRTGLGPQDGTIPSTSPFVTVSSYSDLYDGNGSSRMFLHNYPIQTISLLQIGYWQVPQSLVWGQQGWVIDGSKKSITLRGGSGSSPTYNFWGCGYGGVFTSGESNVQVQYTAGFAATPPDINYVATKAASLNYKRKDWIGLRSKSMAQGAGTTSYEDFEYDIETERCISAYTRWALV